MTATSAEPIGKTPEKPYFLFVGRLEKLKGLQTVIPVFRHYQKAQLLIAGTGSYEPRLRELANGIPNVRFLGYVSGQSLQDLYRQAVAVIVPSICYEIFALVIIEAFRRQAPVIVKDLGGAPETVQESGGGFIYASNEQLIAAMDKLLSSCRDRLGLCGYKTFQEKWTAAAHLKSYFGLIDQITTARGQSITKAAAQS